MDMTETLVVALVTFAAGVIGAVIGGITAYKVAKLSAAKNFSQMHHAEKQKIYSELLESYNMFSGAIEASMINKNWLTDAEERTLYTHFQSAYAKAILISSEETVLVLTNFLVDVNRFAANRVRPETLPTLFSQAVTAMRNELSEDTK